MRPENKGGSVFGTHKVFILKQILHHLSLCFPAVTITAALNQHFLVVLYPFRSRLRIASDTAPRL